MYVISQRVPRLGRTPQAARRPKAALIASAFCSACTWRTYITYGIHHVARQHSETTRHSVVVVETTTTTYQGDQ